MGLILNDDVQGPVPVDRLSARVFCPPPGLPPLRRGGGKIPPARLLRLGPRLFETEQGGTAGSHGFSEAALLPRPELGEELRRWVSVPSRESLQWIREFLFLRALYHVGASQDGVERLIDEVV